MLIHQVDNVQVRTPSGFITNVSVQVYGRDGSRSPISFIILYENRLITPYEQKIRGWGFTITGLFKVHYDRVMSTLIPDCIFMKHIKPDSTWSGKRLYNPIRISV